MNINSPILSLILFSSILLGKSTQYSIAVIDFMYYGIKPELAGTITNSFSKELNTTESMRMMNKSKMLRIFNQKGYDQAGCDSIDCAVIAGYMLGVDQVILGTIRQFDDNYTLDVHIISVQYGKILRSKRISYKGEINGFLVQVKLLAWNLMGLEPPDWLANKEQDRENTLMIEDEKTKSEALVRSLFLPGFGQYYSGKKVSGFAFASTELAFILMAISRQSKFVSLQSDQANIRALYDSATLQDDINLYSSQLISLNDKIKDANSQLMFYTASIAGIWMLNVVHAIVLDPSFSARDKKTRSSALARSILLPGYGQLYNGMKTAGYTFIGLELAFIGLTAYSYSNSISLKKDQEEAQTSYLEATKQEDINRYSLELINLDKKIKSANNLTSLFTVSTVLVWGVNIVHTFIMSPEYGNEVTISPLKLAFDPINRKAQINWEFNF